MKLVCCVVCRNPFYCKYDNKKRRAAKYCGECKNTYKAQWIREKRAKIKALYATGAVDFSACGVCGKTDRYSTGECRFCAKNRAGRSAVNKRERLLRGYGLTLEAYQALYDKQRGCCAICNIPAKLVIDHCHQTGVVRSLLCSPCNSGFGMFHESSEKLQKAVSYALKWGDK